jgi:hypothetical protein
VDYYFNIQYYRIYYYKIINTKKYRLYHDSLLHSLYIFYNLFSAASLICYSLPNTISTTVRKAEDISILDNLNNERGLLFLFK